MAVALIQGASGGIGKALVQEALASNRFDQVIITARDPSVLSWSDPRIVKVALDLCDDDSIERAQASVSACADRLNLVVTTAGVLRDESLGIAPEKKLTDLRRASMRHVFEVNCFGPFLWYAALAPLLRHRETLCIATLSARVGSIGDNRLGGWHSYRASKAAQNMLTQNLSLELRRTNPNAVVIGLHPGTVDTALSKPFQSAVAADKLFTPEFSAKSLWSVISSAQPEQSGKVIAWDNQAIVP